MRFVVFRKADDFTEGGGRPSREGVRVVFEGGATSVVDGPFTESKELVAGFSLLQTRTRDEAVEWLRRWPAEDCPVRLELRQVLEEGDV